ncbi:MAG: LysM peptidoglycan-binding domain-containing protein [Mycobacterium sp.]
MTVLDDRQPVEWSAVWVRPAGTAYRGTVRPRAYRPAPARPAVAPLAYRGYGARTSRAVHSRRQPVSTAASLAVAAAAAAVTFWLGLLAHVSGDPAPAQLPDRLAVVQVQAGESLQQLAGRVAPDAPAGPVVARIRELNRLDSASVDAGQTLIAPIG